MNETTARVSVSASTDVNCFVGGYPFRHLPHPDPDVLVRVLAREGVESAWVGHLPSAFHRDPTHGNTELFTLLERHAGILHPVPAIRPDWPSWRVRLREAALGGAPAVRAYPPQWGYHPDEAAMPRLAAACAEEGIALVLTVRFEDLRQRHPLDVAGDLTPAAVRSLARAGTGARIIVTAAGKDFVEEVHWGLTPVERELVWWDFSWIWGPPTDELALLFRTMGSERFVYGTGWPLRLTQNPRANLELLPEDLLSAQLANPTAWLRVSHGIAAPK